MDSDHHWKEGDGGKTFQGQASAPSHFVAHLCHKAECVMLVENSNRVFKAGMKGSRQYCSSFEDPQFDGSDLLAKS
jgi:hypothetical protein